MASTFQSGASQMSFKAFLLPYRTRRDPNLKIRTKQLSQAVTLTVGK